MSKKIAVLITTDKDKRGVFMGYIDPATANDVTLKVENARMCVYWDADVKGVLGLAATGPTSKSRVSKAVPLSRIHGVTSVTDITEEAEKAWLKEPWGS